MRSPTVYTNYSHPLLSTYVDGCPPKGILYQMTADTVQLTATEIFVYARYFMKLAHASEAKFEVPEDCDWSFLLYGIHPH